MHFHTAFNVQERHNLLKGAFGEQVFPEETDAYNLVTSLSWILPVTVIVGAAVDAALVFVYMKFAHPWKNILFWEEKKEKVKVLKENLFWRIIRRIFNMPNDFM